MNLKCLTKGENMSNFKKIISYRFECSTCGDVINLTGDKFLSQLRGRGWKWDQSIHSSDEEESINSCKNFLCPACVEKKRLDDYNGNDIWKKIPAGYYKDHPKTFNEDVLKYLGISNNHPKAQTLMSIAYDRGHSGGLSEVFSCAIEMEPLLSDVY
jgi:hypothetical protein